MGGNYSSDLHTSRFGINKERATGRVGGAVFRPPRRTLRVLLVRVNYQERGRGLMFTKKDPRPGKKSTKVRAQVGERTTR